MDTYQQHTWSPDTWVLLMLVMVVFLFAITAVFLVGVSKACQATSPREAPDQDEDQAPSLKGPTIPESAVPEQTPSPALSG